MATATPPDQHSPAPQRGHKEALLEGAIQCIQEQGYARTTARDLVAASGTNLASIGYHFGSKEKLLNAAINEGFKRWLAQLAAIAFEEPDAPAIDRLRRSLTAWSESFEEYRPLTVAFVEALAQASHSDELREQLAEQYRTSRDVVTAMVREGLAAEDAGDDVDAAMVASVLIAIVDGLMLQWLLEPERTIDGEAVLASLEAGMRVVGG